jgi:hypothetical protein
MKLPKLPKPNLPLSRLLWVALGLAIVLELLLLYQSVFLGFVKKEAVIETTQTPVRIDLEGFERAHEWIETNSGFVLEPYSLVTPASGRENPFAEY